MRYFQVPRTVRYACASVMLSAAMVFAANPETDQSADNFSTNQPNTVEGAATKTKDGANKTLNAVDHGVHKTARATKRGAKKVKHGANNTMQKVDDAIHDPNQPAPGADVK